MTEVATELENQNTVSNKMYIIRYRHEDDKYGNGDSFFGPFANRQVAIDYLRNLYDEEDDEYGDDDALLDHLGGADGPPDEGVNSIEIFELEQLSQ